MFAIFKRELRAYFTSAYGYVFVGAYLLISGILFSVFTLQMGTGSEISSYYAAILFAFVVLVPLLTMRSLADERKQKTEQLLLTAPITLPGMIFGKFLSAWCMFACTFLVGCVNLLPFYKFSAEEPNTPVILGNIIAVLVVGLAFVAIGIFVSALTENQLIASLGTMLIMLVMLLTSFLNSYIPFAPIREVLNWFSVYNRFSNFTYGVFDFAALLYYVSIAFIFLFLTVRVYEKRRWE